MKTINATVTVDVKELRAQRDWLLSLKKSLSYRDELEADGLTELCDALLDDVENHQMPATPPPVIYVPPRDASPRIGNEVSGGNALIVAVKPLPGTITIILCYVEHKDMYVTWTYDEDGGCCYLGHYFDGSPEGLKDAVADFEVRS